ncbi:MAG: acyl-CoA thioesterase [Ilumatobacteraceae bacterium]
MRSSRSASEPSLRPDDYPFRHRIRVRFAETDLMGVVHHSRYFPYLEEARVAYLVHIGHPYQEWQAAGLNAAVLEAWLRFRLPLRFDDECDVHLRLAAATRTTFEMAYLLTVDGHPAATGATVHGMVTADARPTRLPAWLVDLAAETVLKRFQ